MLPKNTIHSMSIPSPNQCLNPRRSPCQHRLKQVNSIRGRIPKGTMPEGKAQTDLIHTKPRTARSSHRPTPTQTTRPSSQRRGQMCQATYTKRVRIRRIWKMVWSCWRLRIKRKSYCSLLAPVSWASPALAFARNAAPKTRVGITSWLTRKRWDELILWNLS